MLLSQIKEILAGNPAASVLEELSRDGRAGARKLLAAHNRREGLKIAEQARVFALYKYERELAAQGHNRVAGVDEAGRGPLAGPLVVAAAILRIGCFLPGLNDSKQVPARKREELYELIKEQALAFSIEIIPAKMVDSLNIYQATLNGMRKALLSLPFSPGAALIDAMPLTDLPFPTISLVHGDSLSASIAAASILAKVTRDRLMEGLSRQYPQYGFDRHKGYGTGEHVKAIADFGPTPEHRLSFEPLRSMFKAAR
ncbi:MAG: ribonuclease HII [Acidaminococcales bacterium]|jgi:ribonuclease HII|nr:ribonuclease HII [Acidaminococcales bacterium]